MRVVDGEGVAGWMVHRALSTRQASPRGCWWGGDGGEDRACTHTSCGATDCVHYTVERDGGGQCGVSHTSRHSHTPALPGVYTGAAELGQICCETDGTIFGGQSSLTQGT